MTGLEKTGLDGESRFWDNKTWEWGSRAPREWATSATGLSCFHFNMLKLISIDITFLPLWASQGKRGSLVA